VVDHLTAGRSKGSRAHKREEWEERNKTADWRASERTGGGGGEEEEKKKGGGGGGGEGGGGGGGTCLHRKHCWVHCELRELILKRHWLICSINFKSLFYHGRVNTCGIKQPKVGFTNTHCTNSY
jgi:hypothetical protein